MLKIKESKIESLKTANAGFRGIVFTSKIIFVASTTLLVWGVTSAANAGEFVPSNDKTQPGVVRDKGPKGTEVFIRWSDKDGNISLKTDTKTIGENGVVDFPVPVELGATFCPMGIVVLPDGKEACRGNSQNRPVKDFQQYTKKSGAIPKQQLNQLQQTSGEVSVLDVSSFKPIGEDFLVIPFTTFVAENFGINRELRIPDLYADTDENGILGEGDILYSAVNLVDSVDRINAGFTFNIGDSFAIINGSSSLLPGFLFGTQPITRDANSLTGYINPEPFTGDGFVLTEHTVEVVVPEPTSTLSLLALGTLGAGSVLMRKQKHKSTEKQTSKV